MRELCGRRRHGRIGVSGRDGRPGEGHGATSSASSRASWSLTAIVMIHVLPASWFMCTTRSSGSWREEDIQNACRPRPVASRDEPSAREELWATRSNNRDKLTMKIGPAFDWIQSKLSMDKTTGKKLHLAYKCYTAWFLSTRLLQWINDLGAVWLPKVIHYSCLFITL